MGAKKIITWYNICIDDFEDGDFLQDYVILGRNAVEEAIKANRNIDKVLISKNARGVKQLIESAKKIGIVIKYVDPSKLNNFGNNHQGVVALASPIEYVDVVDILNIAKTKGEFPFIIICDRIEDPHNLGAIIRTAEAAGAHGIVIPKRRSASVTPIVEKTSAGAVNSLLVARVSNLISCIEYLKKMGLWIYCADMDGQSWCEVDFSGPVGIIIGSEGFGVGNLVKQKCDGSISLPMMGKINSLNASVAGGIIIYEILRQRENIKAK